MSATNASISTTVSKAPPKLLEELGQRLSECRVRVCDVTARTRSQSDAILGSMPEDGSDRASRPVPHHDGALGMAFKELAALENALVDLEEAGLRLSGIA